MAPAPLEFPRDHAKVELGVVRHEDALPRRIPLPVAAVPRAVRLGRRGCRCEVALHAPVEPEHELIPNQVEGLCRVLPERLRTNACELCYFTADRPAWVDVSTKAVLRSTVNGASNAAASASNSFDPVDA